MSGSTGVFIWTTGDKLVVANVGDSRALLLTQPKSKKFQFSQITTDQTPDIPEEKARVLAAGGIVRPSRGKIKLLTRRSE